MIFFVFSLFLVLVAQIVGIFLPALDWMYGAHIYIVPVIVFYGAMALPFSLMLALAFWAGFLLDALTVQVIGPRVEIAFGWSIILYAVLAGIMHGLGPLVCAGAMGSPLHSERRLHFALFCWSQYLMISFRRGSIFFTPEVWWQIGGPGLIAMLMAPLVFWMLHWLGRATAALILPEEGYQ